jgi:DNA-binding SARP family transcriptional activator
VDPLAEPLYQRLIPLLVAEGRQAEAASWYHRCRSALARWADRQPSAETQHLLNTLQLP